MRAAFLAWALVPAALPAWGQETGPTEGARPHVVFVVGENEYKSERTMEEIGRALTEGHGMRTTFLHDRRIEDDWTPQAGRRMNDLPDLDILAEADLAVFFIRFRTLPPEQVERIGDYLARGKPVVGFRTSTHGFNYAEGDPLRERWNAFGARVLGAPWIYHYGHESSTDVSWAPGAEDHPILKGVERGFHVRSWLYHVLPDYPPETAKLLLMGRSVGPGRGEPEERPVNPVAWTHTHPGGGRVFMTTMGHPEDFEVESFRRLVINGVHWALGLPPPDWPQPRADVPPRGFELRDGERIAFVGDTLIERDLHHGYVETLLTSRFPGRRLKFRNFGWAGDTPTTQARPLNFGPLEQHLDAFGPTVIFSAYGMAASWDGMAGLERFRQDYARLLALFGRTGARVVVLSPIRHEALGPPLPDPSEHNRALELYSKAVEELAADAGFRFVDLFNAFQPAPTGEMRPLVTDNGVHPNAYGYWRIGWEVLRALGLTPAGGWELRLKDRGTAGHEIVGARLFGVDPQPHGARFEVLEGWLDPPAPPIDAGEGGARRGEFFAEQPSGRLWIDGLPPGRYDVLRGGELLRRFDISGGESGRVFLDLEGDAAPAEALRQAIVRKNRTFFHRWRAHNGEYIYGRRAQAGGGNAGNEQFPAEMEALEALIRQQEARIAERAQPTPRSYEIRPR